MSKELKEAALTAVHDTRNAVAPMFMDLEYGDMTTEERRECIKRILDAMADLAKAANAA